MRSVAALGAGLGFMAASVTVGTLLASTLFGAAAAASPVARALLFAVTLAVCGFGGILGGWLAARIAAFAPDGHAAVMAAIVAALSVGTALSAAAPGHPAWYPPLLGFVEVVGILLGGKLRGAAATAPGV